MATILLIFHTVVMSSTRRDTNPYPHNPIQSRVKLEYPSVFIYVSRGLNNGNEKGNGNIGNHAKTAKCHKSPIPKSKYTINKMREVFGVGDWRKENSITQLGGKLPDEKCR
jgi:hypothetical protein